MNANVKDFISTNLNKNVKWQIDGDLFATNKFIPDSLLWKSVISWKVNQWEGIIEISTE